MNQDTINKVMELLFRFEQEEKGNRISSFSFAALRQLIVQELTRGGVPAGPEGENASATDVDVPVHPEGE